MGKKPSAASQPAGPTKTFKYGMPLYGLVWPEGPTFYTCGGGGSMKSGIQNRLVSAEANAGLLTDQTGEYVFGKDCPMRLALSPGAKSLVFAMGKGGIQRLDLDARGKTPKFTEITGALEDRLREVTLDVKAMAFHPSGELLALGAEDGSVAVYEWPSMRLKLDLSGERKLPEAVKDLDFAPHGGSGPAAAGRAGGAGGGRALVVVLDNGAVEVLDVDAKGALLCRVRPAKGGEFKSDKVLTISNSDRLLLHHLPAGMENAQFSRVRCRAVPPPAGPDAGSAPPAPRHVLTCLLNNRNGAHLSLWELGPDGLLTMCGAGRVAESPGTCLDVSADGALAVVGTSEGDVVLAGCRPHVRPLKRYPKAHMVFTTAITFNTDASYVLSASADASVTVNSTALPSPPDFKKFMMLLFFVLTILLLVLLQTVRVLKRRGMSMGQILALVGLRSHGDEL